MNPVQDLENIYRDAVREVDPAGLIRSCVKIDGRQLTIQTLDQKIPEDLSRYRQVIVLGIGKASARMASAMEDILTDEISSGFVITKYGHGLKLNKIQVREAGHPVPDENSLEGACILAQMASAADENTLIINLISGGGSSLFCLPADGISLEDKRQTTSALLASGANIEEMNCIRKHLSRVKGGGLARIASPARLINLILSDVIGDRIDTIASGITAPDPTTFQDALSIVRKYNLEDKLPQAVRDHLAGERRGRFRRRRKRATPYFAVPIISFWETTRWPAVRRGKPRNGWDIMHASSARRWPVRQRRQGHVSHVLPKILLRTNPIWPNRRRLSPEGKQR